MFFIPFACGILKGSSVCAPNLHFELSRELKAELPYLLLYLFEKGSVIYIYNDRALF